jgi:DNA polymerase-3 subunit alpha
MQIVRDLAGYSYGRSDLVRRAMAKKKVSVMIKERNHFVYGNKEEGVPGCISKGIPEAVANHIFDEMMDFANYAFNKSHAAAYAVVSYQTAYLKAYYPVEFMAALMTSVIDNPGKVAEYIYNCRQMNIKILPPDINEGDADFTVKDGAIRYALSAIKGVGKPVIDAIVAERQERGCFKSLKDFAQRLSGKEVNKRTIESFIKAGVFTNLHQNRRQLMLSYIQILDQVAEEKKKSLTGQMTLFDLVGDEDKLELEVRMPDVSEYADEQLLAFEKEVLGIYVSGHPLDSYLERIKKNVTVYCKDFEIDEESGKPKVEDGNSEIIGGMVTSKTVKTTKNNSMMAFIAVEDLFGVVEVIIFPRDYEKYKAMIEPEQKIFVRGKVTVEEEKAAKLICQEIIPFNSIPQELWIKYPDVAAFIKDEQSLYSLLEDYDGDDSVVIYCEKEKCIKRLPKSKNVKADKELIHRLLSLYREENVRITEKSIEKLRKID